MKAFSQIRLQVEEGFQVTLSLDDCELMILDNEVVTISYAQLENLAQLVAFALTNRRAVKVQVDGETS